jgi:predicted PurR-regulated permease PerM
MITLAVALVILVPLALGITQIAFEAREIAAWVSAAKANGIPSPVWLGKLPLAGESLTAWWQANLATPDSAALQLHKLASADIVSHTRLIGSNVLHRIVIFTFTLLTLFFLLRDRDVVIAQCLRASDRLLGAAGERIGRQAIRSVRGTIDGLILVGIGEGAAMTVAYLILDVPHPLLLGTITAVAAMIPFGAALMFAVAAVLLLGKGSVAGAVIILVVGFIVLGIADHFIRPALIGGAIRLPFLWVLIGILGGAEAFGVLGLFVGPATMAVLVMLWREFIIESDPGNPLSSD